MTLVHICGHRSSDRDFRGCLKQTGMDVGSRNGIESIRRDNRQRGCLDKAFDRRSDRTVTRDGLAQVITKK